MAILPYSLNAVTPGIGTGFDLGVEVHGFLANKFGYEVGLWNGTGSAQNGATKTISDDIHIPSLLYAGRLTYQPKGAMPMTQGNPKLQHEDKMLIGVSANYNVESENESTNDFRAGVEFAMLKNRWYIGAEAYYMHIGFTDRQKIDDTYNYWGGYAQVGYFVHPQMQLGLRYDFFDRNGTTKDGILNMPAATVNYFVPKTNIKLSAMYQYIGSIVIWTTSVSVPIWLKSCFNMRSEMKKYRKLLVALSFSAALVSCDDGRIYPETVVSSEGKTVILEGVLDGLDSWTSSYRVSIAGFEGADDEYADVSKVISASDVVNGKVNVELSGIKENVTLVRLCILDRLRKHIVTFSEVDVSKATEVVKMDVGTINISMFNAIQQAFFNTTCANCHGASNRAAAGLYLTEGKSYEALVDVDSKKVEGKKLVETNNANNSVLHMVLNQQKVEGISMDHRDLVSEKNEMTILPLIDSWINNGAKER